MFGSEEGLLARMFRAREATPGHRQALENELLARFQTRQPIAPRSSVTKRYRPLIAASLLAVVAAGAAAAAPTHLDVEVGRSIDIHLPPGAPVPENLGEAFHLTEANGLRKVAIRVMAEDAGTDIHVDLLANDLPAQLAPTLRAAIPALASVPIEEKPLSASVRTSMGKRVAHELFDLDLDTLSVEEAQRAVEARLAAQGITGADVKIERTTGADGKPETKLKVQKREISLGETEGAGDGAHGMAALHLAPGDRARVRIPFDAGRIDVEDRSIVDVTPSDTPRLLTVRALAAGKATVQVFAAGEPARSVSLEVVAGAE
ncbi:MAG TPA: pilus assembly protein N-terminal domain-containing protein [bacterium]|nr:pilus assembly protein N-terminal domain-containing protein [bacterium]